MHAVQLIGKKNIGKDRAFAETELTHILVIDLHPDHISRLQVNSPLDSRKFASGDERNCFCQGCLSGSGQSFDQDVALGKECNQDEIGQVTVPYNKFTDLFRYCRMQPGYR